MAEIKDKIVTIESLSALHEHNKGTYATKSDVNGIASSIQTKLDGKADSGHTHDYLPLSGGKLTGTLTVNDLILVSGVNYGDTLPTAGTVGRIFLKRVVE